MIERRFSESAARNTRPILEILRRELRACTDVLEIGSGTGQHAVAFATQLPHLRWQTSDLDENHAMIRASISGSGGGNVSAPLVLDVRTAVLEPATFDAVFSANTAHIMNLGAVQSMFALVGDVLRAGGVFCLYGPFRVGGAFNSESNERFDSGLRQRDAAMGIRDLETLDEFGAGAALRRQRLYAMPSNNYVAVWARGLAA